MKKTFHTVLDNAIRVRAKNEEIDPVIADTRKMMRNYLAVAAAGCAVTLVLSAIAKRTNDAPEIHLFLTPAN